MKKALWLILIAGLLLVSSVPCVGREPFMPDIIVKVEGETLTFDQKPFIQNGEVFVPVRFIFETLGYSVKWEEMSQTAIAEKAGAAIRMQIGNPELLVGDEPVILDSLPILVGDRTLVPAQAFSDAIGANVSWRPYRHTMWIFSAEYVENLLAKPSETYLGLLGMKPDEIQEVLGANNGFNTYTISGGNIKFNFDSYWRTEQQNPILYPAPSSSCESVHGPLCEFWPDLPHQLSLEKAVMYLGDIHREHVMLFKGNELMFPIEADAYVHEYDTYRLCIVCGENDEIDSNAIVWLIKK